MKKWIYVLITMALILAIFFLPLPAFAGQSDTFSYKGDSESSFASFSSVDEAGIQTNITINAHDNTRHVAPGAVETSSGVELQIFQFDSTCPPWISGCPTYIMIARAINAPLADKDFQAPAVALGSWAKFNTTVNVFDQVSNASFDVFIDMTWTCLGDVTRDNRGYRFVLPSAVIDIASNHNAYCDAQASGSISDGQTNFTPNSSLDAGIFSGTTVEVEISISN